MTVSAVSPPRWEYTQDGVGTGPYAYTVKIVTKNDLEVLDVTSGGASTLLVVDTDYTVAGVGDAGGGSISTIVAGVNGNTLIILRKQPVSQLSDYLTNQDFDADGVELDLDKLLMILQMFDERLLRVLGVPKKSLKENLEVDDPIADAFLQWKTDLSGVKSVTPSPTGGAPLSNAVPPATAATGLAGTGTSVRRDDAVVPLGDHDHSNTAGDGGKLTNDEHDGYLEVVLISEPSTPASGRVRMFLDSSALLRVKKGDGVVYPLEPGAITTTKGDLLVRGNASLIIREPVGANGTILEADSAQTSGIKWGTAPKFTKEFISADTALTATTITEFTHGLGVAPKLVQITLINVTTEFGWVTGDEISFHTVSTRYIDWFVLAADATTKISGVTGSNTPHITRKDTQAEANATLANWNYRLRAWA